MAMLAVRGGDFLEGEPESLDEESDLDFLRSPTMIRLASADNAFQCSLSLVSSELKASDETEGPYLASAFSRRCWVMYISVMYTDSPGLVSNGESIVDIGDSVFHPP